MILKIVRSVMAFLALSLHAQPEATTIPRATAVAFDGTLVTPTDWRAALLALQDARAMLEESPFDFAARRSAGSAREVHTRGSAAGI